MRQTKTSAKVATVPKVWLSNIEAQAYLGMGADFMERLRNEALVHYYVIGRSIFYKVADIDAMLEKHREI